jgi:hypothetical protein
MKDTSPHLRVLEEIEKEDISGVLEVLREEGTDGVRYALWDGTGWHRDAVLDAVNTATGRSPGTTPGFRVARNASGSPDFWAGCDPSMFCRALR